MAAWTISAFKVVAVLLVTSCVSAQQLISSVPITPVLRLQAARVIPDVVDGVLPSPETLAITYIGYIGVTSVGLGNELTGNSTQKVPDVYLDNANETESLYTLVLSDPDIPDPSIAGPNSSYLHWLVTDIPVGGASNNIAKIGLVLAPYQPPAPPSGLHRYVFQLYKQVKGARIGNITLGNRLGFLPKTFAATYGLGNPVAVYFFRAQPAGENNLTTNSTPVVVQVQELLRGRVIPEVVPLFTPLARLNVSYGNGTLVNGQILIPTEVTAAPAVYAQGLSPGTVYNSTFPYYTLMIVDADAPDPTNPNSSLILHYLKFNIPTNTPTANIVNVTTGNVLLPYYPPSPLAGLHRYTLLLYGQGRLSNATAPASRSRFNLTSFALNNTLSSPLAAFYFNCFQPVNTTSNPTTPAVIPPSPTPTVTTPVPTPVDTTPPPTAAVTIPSGGAPTLFPLSPPPPAPSPSSSPTSILPIVGGVAAAAAVLLALATMSLFCWYRRKKRLAGSQAGLKEEGKDEMEDKGLSEPGLGFKPRREHFTLRQLRKATGNFSSTSIVGKGSFGVVYKGVLEDGLVVAVKRLDTRPGRQDLEEKSWMAEVEALGKVRHRSLVPLLGVCAERGERLLVFEHFARGNLSRRLHEPRDEEQPLSWADRKRIARSICRGLTYLHNDIRPPMVHRDIKAANILLTDDDTPDACIADFGLAHLMQDKGGATSTMIKGTVPYMAPEYLQGGARFLSPKCDVYSFGMLFLELVTGRPVVRQLETGVVERLSEDVIHMIREDKVLELVDPLLEGDYIKEEAQKYLHLAMSCLRKDPSTRPTMEQVGMHLASAPISEPTFTSEDLWASEGLSTVSGGFSSASNMSSADCSTVLVASRFVTPR